MFGKPGKKPHGRPRRRLDNIKIGLTEIRLQDVDWINLAQAMGKSVSCEYGNTSSGSTKYAVFLDLLRNYEFLQIHSAPWLVLTKVSCT